MGTVASTAQFASMSGAQNCRSTAQPDYVPMIWVQPGLLILRLVVIQHELVHDLHRRPGGVGIVTQPPAELLLLLV